MITIPEHILKSVLDGIILTISNDIMLVSERENTILYRLFGELGVGSFKYYDQAVAMFSFNNGKARRIKTKMSFDGDMSSFPVIYVTTGSDKYNFSGIGMTEYDQTFGDPDTRIYPKLSTRFTAESSIVIASDSIEEVLILYHVIRAMIIASIVTMSESGLENMKIGGMDIRTEDDLIPKNVFMKAISLEYEYDVIVPSTVYSYGEAIRDIIVQNIAIANEAGGNPYIIRSIADDIENNQILT